MLTPRKRLVILASVLVLVLPVMPSALATPQAKTYTVNSDAATADANPGDGVCDIGAWLSYCTLPAAIQEANLDGTISTINFASPMNINYPSLPAITETGTTIDAGDRWDGTWPGGRPGVQIIGGGLTAPVLSIQADGTTVYGIEFVSGSGVAIEISGSGGGNQIGGNDPQQRNVFSTGTGVRVQTTGANNAIVGNYFGTWDGENPVPSDVGVDVRWGATLIEHNVIGGHRTAGIFIWNGDSNIVQYNTVGANVRGNSTISNTVGIQIIEADSNIVRYNLIAGSSSHGIELRRADNNTIANNTIGDPYPKSATASSSLGNGGDGIHAFDADNNKFGESTGSNTIAKNGGYGVWLDGDDNFVQGNTIYSSGQDGVYIQYGKQNQIGGAGPLRNEIGKNGGSGVHLAGTGTVSNTVSGNYIGLDSGAWDAGNQGYGVLIENGASGNRIGGLGAGEGNWVGYNDWSGVFVSGAKTQGNIVDGNVVGAPITWNWVAPNGHHGIGIYNGAHNNWIGIANTVVSANWSGIAIVGSSNNVVWFNYVGTNAAGLSLGNSYYGIAVVNSAGNAVFANEVARNGTNAGEAGVRIDGGLAGNPINVNSIHDNGGPGIELVNGGNFGLGAPTISQASCQGTVSGTSCAGCTVEIFSDTADEGRIYEASVTTYGGGAFSWSGTLHGPHVTTTATTVTGATSAFSAPTDVGACIVPRAYLSHVTR